MGVQLEQSAEEVDQQRCFAGNLSWLLYKAHWALASELTAALAPLGLSARGYHVLRAALTGRTTSPSRSGSIMIAKNPTHAIAMILLVGTLATGRNR